MNKPPEEPSFESKLTNAMLQSLVFAGGAYALYSLLLDDIAKAAISSLIALSASFLTSFGQGFMSVLRTRLQQRGAETADRISNTLEYPGLENRYLESQALACQEYIAEGLSLEPGIFIPMLEDVYIPLNLSTVQSENYSQNIKVPEHGALTIWNFLKQVDKQPTFRKIALLSNAGYGKSTLLHHITYVYATRKRDLYQRSTNKIPFLLELRKCFQVFTEEKSVDLPRLIHEYHIPNLPKVSNLNVPISWVKNTLIQGQAIVMLDGFDEVATLEKNIVSQWINSQVFRYPNCIFILTSRPLAYENDYNNSLFTTNLFIKPFDQTQQEHFIKNWYLAQERYASGGGITSNIKERATDQAKNLISQIRLTDKFQSIASNPVLLTMLINLHRNIGKALPKKRTELYKKIIDFQLYERPRSKGITSPVHSDAIQFILQDVALEMTIKSRLVISRELLINILNNSLRTFNSNVQPDEFITYLTQVSGLLIEKEMNEYQFTHSIFQIYLSAVKIHQEKNEDLLLDRSKEAFWKDIIYLYIEKINDPRSFIRKLVDPIANPYVVGSPVVGNLFVGRDDILRRFKELWGNSSQLPSIVLYGHRRMGKTSILRNLTKHIQEDVVVDFNMQRVGYVDSTGELLYNLALAIYYAISLKQKNTLDEPCDNEFLSKNPITRFDQFLKEISPSLDNQKLIITVDEFEIIEDLIREDKIDSHLLEFWRSLIQTYPWFVMVFAGLHTLHEMTHDYWNPLFGSVHIIPVSFLSPKATELLITTPSPDFELDYVPEAVELIYNLTYGQPYLVQLICHNLVSFFNRERFEKGIYREPPLTATDVETVVNMPEFYRDGNAYFTGIWEQAKEFHGQEQLKVLKALSCQSLTCAELVQQTAMSSTKIYESLETLVRHDVIQQYGDHYTYRVELMRRWVVRQQANYSVGAG